LPTMRTNSIVDLSVQDFILEQCGL
jgi:hypothetical protein